MDIKSYIEEKGKKAREGARRLATLSTAVKNNALIAMAEAIELDADRLKRENRKDIEAILGYKDYDEVIHRDNLVIL